MRSLLLIAAVIAVIALTKARFGNVNEPHPHKKNARGMRFQQMKEKNPEMVEQFAAFETNFREERKVKTGAQHPGSLRQKMMEKLTANHQAAKEQQDKRNHHGKDEETEEVDETKPEEVEETEPEEVEETEAEDATGSRRRRAVPKIDPNTIEAVPQVIIGGGRRARGCRAAPNMNPEERKEKMARFHELVKKHGDEFKAIRANESLSKKEKMQQMAAIVKKERQQ